MNNITRNDWRNLWAGHFAAVIGVIGPFLFPDFLIHHLPVLFILVAIGCLSYLWLAILFWGLFRKLNKPVWIGLGALIAPPIPLVFLLYWHFRPGTSDIRRA